MHTYTWYVHAGVRACVRVCIYTDMQTDIYISFLYSFMHFDMASIRQPGVLMIYYDNHEAGPAGPDGQTNGTS